MPTTTACPINWIKTPNQGADARGKIKFGSDDGRIKFVR